MVSNALKSWIHYSSKKFLPEVARILDKVEIISAREQFEKEYPNNSEKWKIHAFLQAKENPELLTNIIAISDSQYDLNAAHNFSKYFFYIT